MNRTKGWTGNMLTIDLTRNKVDNQSLADDWLHKYVGARGFAVRMLYDLTGPETDPLGPENVAIIGAGPLTGTLAPASSRCEVVSKSPLTGMYGRADVGGKFGALMKYAGYDIIVVKGKAEQPVYIWIDDDIIEIRDARDLWGLDVWQTRKKVFARYEPASLSSKHFLKPISSMLIGPAGENLSLAAAVMCGAAHAAGLGGLGAVWGSKNLKGIAVRGTQGVTVADKMGFRDAILAAQKEFKDPYMSQVLAKYGFDFAMRQRFKNDNLMVNVIFLTDVLTGR